MAETKDYLKESADSFGNELKLNELYYNCSECQSYIEILSINEKESIIEFKCIKNNHKIKMPIKEYIIKMKNFNSKNINDDICYHHKKKYKCYCLDCNKHICKDCLNSRNHINHNKYLLIEFKPNEKEMKELENKVKYYENQIENLEIEKFIKLKEINNKLRESKDKLNKEENKNENNNKIIVKEIDNLDNDNIEQIQKIEYNAKLEKMNYLKRLYEIIYNTYNLHNNNYFNAINVNNILIYNDKNKNENTIKINNEKKKMNQKINSLKSIENPEKNMKYNNTSKVNNIQLYKENKININKLENEKLSFIAPLIFSFLSEKRKLETIKYNKRFQNIININLYNYKLSSKKYIIYETKEKGKEYNYNKSELVFEGKFINGKRKEGKEYKKGELIFEGGYLNGKRNGKGKEYYYNGKLIFEGEYLDGKFYKGNEKNIMIMVN